MCLVRVKETCRRDIEFYILGRKDFSLRISVYMYIQHFHDIIYLVKQKSFGTDKKEVLHVYDRIIVVMLCHLCSL